MVYLQLLINGDFYFPKLPINLCSCWSYFIICTEAVTEAVVILSAPYLCANCVTRAFKGDHGELTLSELKTSASATLIVDLFCTLKRDLPPPLTDIHTGPLPNGDFNPLRISMISLSFLDKVVYICLSVVGFVSCLLQEVSG